MMKISPVTFTASKNKNIKVSEEKREEIRDGVVAGGAAGAGYTAVRKNAINMIKETETACKAGKAAAAARAANTAASGSGIFAGLKNNARVLTKRLVTRVESIKASRFIKPIINNRLVKFGCGVVGGFLAVCVLISGIGTLYHNTVKMADNYIPKVAHRVNRLAERLDSDEKKD